MEVLAANGQIDIDQAAAELGVSSATIRRDLDELTAQQMLVRTRGGAVGYSVSYDLPLRYKVARHASEKQRIAAAAAAMVAPGSVVGLTGGTTTTEVGRVLGSRTDLRSDSGPVGFALVTNALNIANELAVRPNLKIVTTGGVLRPQSYELIGPFATGVLNEITLDIAFIGVDGIDPYAAPPPSTKARPSSTASWPNTPTAWSSLPMRPKSAAAPSPASAASKSSTPSSPTPPPPTKPSNSSRMQVSGSCSPEAYFIARA